MQSIEWSDRKVLPRSCPVGTGSLPRGKAAEVTGKEGLCGAGTRPKQMPLQKGNPKVKYAKTAAFVAGSVVALGTAAPAFAATAATAPSLSLDGGVNQVLAAAPQGVDPIVDTVGGAAESVQKKGASPRSPVGPPVRPRGCSAARWRALGG